MSGKVSSKVQITSTESKNLYSKQRLKHFSTAFFLYSVNKSMAIKQYITRWPYPGRVWLVELVEHDHCCATIVKDQPPKVRRCAWQRVRGHNKSSLPMEAVSKSSVDVIVTLPFCCNQKGQGAIRRQNIHAAVLFSVSGQQSNAALFHIQVGSHRVERLQMETLNRWDESGSRMKWN